tara:strand:- start:2579 stop:2758 length:180 start_codon:yes stop_codon:yes gene_type:complete
MITKRELENVVVQVNVVLDQLAKRIESLEKQNTILLHDIKNFVQEKPSVKLRGRPKKNG